MEEKITVQQVKRVEGLRGPTLVKRVAQMLPEEVHPCESKLISHISMHFMPLPNEYTNTHVGLEGLCSNTVFRVISHAVAKVVSQICKWHLF